MKWLALILPLLILSSCFAPKQVRKNARAERYIDKAVRLNPDLATPSVVIDTVVVRDTILIEESRTDTVLEIQPGRVDTIIEERAEVVIRWREAEAEVSVISLTDTVYLEKEIIREIECPEQVIQSTKWRWLRSGYRWLMWGLIFVIAVCAAALALKVLKR